MQATDPRTMELEALALEEGFRLPMAVEKILRLEDRGFVVCLCSGRVQMPAVGLPTPSAQALCHLYGVDDADLAAIFAPVVEDVPDLDLFDYEGEAQDYEDDIEDRDFWRQGNW